MSDEFARLASYDSGGVSGDPRRFMPAGWDGVSGVTRHGRVWMAGCAWFVLVGDIVADYGRVLAGVREVGPEVLDRQRAVMHLTFPERGRVTFEAREQLRFFGPPEGRTIDPHFAHALGIEPISQV